MTNKLTSSFSHLKSNLYPLPLHYPYIRAKAIEPVGEFFVATIDRVDVAEDGRSRSGEHGEKDDDGRPQCWRRHDIGWLPLGRTSQIDTVWVNQFSDISPQGPYGGYKQSGFGRTGGLEGLHEFLQVKNIRIGMR